MARSGSLAALEQRLAAQRREDDRLARERRQRDKDSERLRQQEHLESQQRAAEEETAALQERMKALDELLTSVLPLRPLSFDRLMAVPRTPEFDPGPLGTALQAPTWDDFAPVPPTGPGRFLSITARHGRQLAEAQARFEAAQTDHQRQESERRRALATAKARYDRKVTEERAKAVSRNAYVTRRQSAFAVGDAEAVQWFVDCVLRASKYPDGFPREHQVAYRPERREVAVDFELPPRGVVPAARTYRYVKARDVVEPVPRADSEISQCYERLVACVALRTLHEVFGATSPDLVQAVSFTGRVSTVDRATGKPLRPELLSVSAERSAFDDLILAAVDPAACLNALASSAEGPGPR
jgi:restriction system protein